MDFSTNSSYDVLTEKWEPLLSHEALPSIGDSYRKKVTAVLLENQEKALREQYLVETPANNMGGGFSVTQAAGSAGNLAGYDPILISLVRRSMPNLIAYDIAGVQPMTAPTGLIFAMRSRYDQQAPSLGGVSNSGDKRYGEALFQEAFAKFGGSGNTSNGAAFSPTGGINPVGASAGVQDASTSANWGIRDSAFSMNAFRGFLTGTAEQLGEAGGTQFREMAFSIERIAVEAKTRALKAEYTTELAQDLKAVHGLDAESELANILSTEILNEINRELITTIYRVAKTGATQSDLTNFATGGVYDLNTDSDGRWSAERFRGLMFQIERECNVIAKETRRGKGNFLVCSSDVASALTMGGFLNLAPAMTANLDVDDTGNTFVGVLNNKMKVYIDPYAKLGVNFCVVGYRGTSPYDAGIFYCPYVPLQMVRAVDQNTFQPKIGFKTRYGMVANPFSENTDINALGGNQYYRIFQVTNLHGNTGFGL
jgi:hypothetical protein